MTNEEIAKANELIKRKIEAMDSSVYMSVEWLLFCGEYQGIAKIMIEFGYKWNGSEFAEVSHG